MHFEEALRILDKVHTSPTLQACPRGRSQPLSSLGSFRLLSDVTSQWREPAPRILVQKDTDNANARCLREGQYGLLGLDPDSHLYATRHCRLAKPDRHGRSGH